MTNEQLETGIKLRKNINHYKFELEQWKTATDILTLSLTTAKESTRVLTPQKDIVPFDEIKALYISSLEDKINKLTDAFNNL